MIKLFTDDAWNDYLYWLNNDITHLKRINKVIKSSKPEPLKSDLKSYWSRRINDEHRLIYRIDDRKGSYCFMQRPLLS